MIPWVTVPRNCTSTNEPTENPARTDRRSIAPDADAFTSVAGSLRLVALSTIVALPVIVNRRSTRRLWFCGVCLRSETAGTETGLSGLIDVGGNEASSVSMTTQHRTAQKRWTNGLTP